MAREMQISESCKRESGLASGEANQPPAVCVSVVEAKAQTQVMQSAVCQLVEVDRNREDVF